MTGRARATGAGPSGAADRAGGPVEPGRTTRACWVLCARVDVPPGDDWLGEAERSVLARLRIAKRRDDFRAGRWAAKQALARCLIERGAVLAPADIEVVAAADGAPEALVLGGDAGVSVSLSHSGEVGFAVACAPPLPVGCDVERVEPRTPEFVRDYFTNAEAAQVEAASLGGRALLATLLWSAKESALKVRREGLRADTRSIAVALAEDPTMAPHGRFTATPVGGGALHGCWWRAGEHVCTVVAAVRREPVEWSAPEASGAWTLPVE